MGGFSARGLGKWNIFLEIGYPSIHVAMFMGIYILKDSVWICMAWDIPHYSHVLTMLHRGIGISQNLVPW